MPKKQKNNKIEQIQDDFEATRLEVYVKLLKKRASGEKLNRKETALLKTLEENFNRSPNPDDLEIKTQEAAAKYLGVSQRVISYHVGRGNLKSKPDGTFLKAELDRWAVEHGRRKDYGKSKKYTERQQKYDAEFRKARAEEKQLVVAQLRGKLISIGEIESAWAARVERVTAGLEALINRLPPILVGKDRREIAKILTEEIHDLRKQYATDGKYCPKKGG